MAKKHKFEVLQIQEAWQQYKLKADNHVVREVSAGKVLRVPRPRVYTLESFLVHLGLSRQAWSEYCKSAKYEDVCAAISDEVFARKKEAMVNGEGHVTGLIFDMKANYGIQDKQVVEQKVDINSVEVRLLPAINGAQIPTSEKDVDV